MVSAHVAKVVLWISSWKMLSALEREVGEEEWVKNMCVNGAQDTYVAMGGRRPYSVQDGAHGCIMCEATATLA